MTLLRLVSFSTMVTELLGCGGDTQSPRSAAAESTSVPPAPPVSGPDTKNCAVTMNDQCFGTYEEACAALGCAPSQCQIAYSYPAQVTCR
jgi:hypothetical protein